MPLTQSKRVAIIGGGCAGVTCFWALQDSVHDVHLFEASSSLGGRIKTFPFEYGKTQADVDTESPCFNAEASRQFAHLCMHIFPVQGLTLMQLTLSRFCGILGLQHPRFLSFLVRPMMLAHASGDVACWKTCSFVHGGASAA